MATKVKRTEAKLQNPSLLDTSIDQILSGEKLDGDTANLLFKREAHMQDGRSVFRKLSLLSFIETIGR